MFVSFVLQLMSVFALSMAMDKHFKSVFKKNSSVKFRIYCKALGWLVLIVSLFIPIIFSKVPNISIVIWFGNLSLCIILVAVYLSFKSARLSHPKGSIHKPKS